MNTDKFLAGVLRAAARIAEQRTQPEPVKDELSE